MTNQVDREEVEWVENRARELCTGNERNKVETITAVRNVMINAYRATAAAIWSQWPERSRGQGLSAVWVVYGDEDIDPSELVGKLRNQQDGHDWRKCELAG